MIKEDIIRMALEALESGDGWRQSEAITALRTAIEQAEKQEPVAYKPPAKWTDAEIKDGYRGIRWVTADGVYGRPTEEDVARYLGYTTPPQRKPLTDEQIVKCWGQVSGTRYGYVAFARAIEAKLKEKNSD